MTEPQQSGDEPQGFQLPPPGAIAWHDLTVPNAEEIRDFYCQLLGWNHTDLDMGGYNDYSIHLPGRDPDAENVVGGICHARGENANIPPQWLMYVVVADVAASAQRCVELGGQVLDGPRAVGDQNFCVIRDPAGAVAALIGG